MSDFIIDRDIPHAGKRLPPLIGQSPLRDLRMVSTRMLSPPEAKPNFKGYGYLSGSFPDGITRVEGVPQAAEIRVLYRPLGDSEIDGYLVAKTVSSPDGTWIIQGLNHNLKYDVICRHEGYNDMILSNVSPALDAGLGIEGSGA